MKNVLLTSFTLFISTVIFGQSSFGVKGGSNISKVKNLTASPIFEEFIAFSASNGLLEFKGQGAFGELLHDIFDEVILEYEFQEEVETDIMTTWRNDGPND